MAQDNFIKAQGLLDGAAAEKLTATMTSDINYIIDFSDVSSINFAALRTLLRFRKSGKRFSIVNADACVAEKFEDTGVSSFISICRKPRPLKMSDWEEFGASYLSKSYNSKDKDAMIKIYDRKVPKWMVAQEKVVARAVMQFGLNTPLVGTIYEDGEFTGLDFERIEGKRSFSRIIADEPERLEEMSRRFARMCKQLHSTECDTAIFADRSDFYRGAALRNTDLSDEERKAVLAFLDSVPKATTCLHGDMQPSNVITTGKEDMWIDLGDFGYGNPMFDMGMWFFLSVLIPEQRAMSLFHLHSEDMRNMWDFFIDEYFGADTAEKKAEITAKTEKFAALHMLAIGTMYGFEPGMMDFVKAKLTK